MNKHLIYGDIGGTKTILQLAELKHGNTQELDFLRYRSRDYATFSDILGDFLNKTIATKNLQHPTAACFAIAGPIVDQHAKLTNLPWHMNAAEIAREFSIPFVKLLNDFEAAALAIETLPPENLATLQKGRAHPQAMRVVLGAGTGMGVAWLSWQKDGYRSLSTEAGHIDFAPTNTLQIQLLEAMMKKFKHVSIERLLSGPGLTNIFRFLQTSAAEFANFAPVSLEEDSGAMITTLASQQHHPVAIKSLELFTEIYGAYAGNLALAGLCRNGVYIAGGIAPRIIDTLRTGNFMHAFCNKGRFSGLMREIPVHVITNPSVSLLGAKKEARHLLHMQDQD